MKKIITLILLSFLIILGGCSIDFNDDKDKKIQDLEKQVVELNKNKETELFNKKQECIKYKSNFINTFNILYKDAKNISEKSNSAFDANITGTFYSNKLNSCIFEVSLTYYIDDNYGSLKLYHDYLSGEIFDIQNICNNIPFWTFKDLCISGKVKKIKILDEIQ